MKKLFIMLVTVACICSCVEYENRRIPAVVVNKFYTPARNTTMPVPYRVGKISGTRLQPVHYNAKYQLEIEYIDEHYTNYKKHDIKDVNKDIFEDTNISDTVICNCQIIIKK